MLTHDRKTNWNHYNYRFLLKNNYYGVRHCGHNADSRRRSVKKNGKLCNPRGLPVLLVVSFQWQQTEDFGRKKQIRTHMYKLREARLKEFYTTGEVLKDVQRSNSSPGLREQNKKNSQKKLEQTHADSLIDHSFLSLKSKEIRDSESPTRDVSYRSEFLNFFLRVCFNGVFSF